VLENAILAATAAADLPLIKSSALNAIAAVKTLTNEMSSNDDNLTRSSLALATEAYKTTQTSFANLGPSTTSARVPYAQSLQSATVNLDFWTKVIAAKAVELASQVKAAPIAANAALESATVLSGTPYQRSLDALAANQDTASALQAYIRTPTDTKKAAAASALTNSLNQLPPLIGQANLLSGTLNSALASATSFPTIWLSSRCDFLQLTQKTWWRENQWKSLVLFQVSDILATNPGSLSVNGTTGYHLVVLAAGRALSAQNRATPSTSNYLEGTNSSLSRDGDAITPEISFNAAPPSATFNDRLSY
jgi:hypothetical protein